MFDTVRITWPRATYHQPVPLPDWKVSRFSHSARTDLGTAEERHGVRYHHEPTGLVASGGRFEIKTVTVSLPHLLFGTNAKLIQSQADIDQALLRADELLSQVSAPAPIDRFTRIDLTWQFRIDPKLAIIAHRHSRHLRIRRDSTYYEGESLHWKGRALHIRMYDKALQMNGKPGDVLRAEVEVHGRLLRDLLAPGQAQVTRLDFNRAYAAYRELMLGFMTSTVPTVSGITEILCIGDAAGWTFQNLSLFEIWARDKHPEHVRRVQKEMASLRPRYFNLDWAQILPAEGPPPAVELCHETVP